MWDPGNISRTADTCMIARELLPVLVYNTSGLSQYSSS